MKKILTITISFLMAWQIFATPLIDAAKNQDYKTFEKLVKEGASLDEKNESGMNVQLALAYFNEKDFKKACTLLANKNFDFDIPVENNISLLYVLAYSCSYEKLSTLLKYDVDVNRANSITNLKPIDTTQFCSYKFYSEQKMDSSYEAKAKKTRDLLLKNGSAEFTYSEPKLGNVGNMFFCLFNVINAFYPFVTPQMINSSELFEFSELNGQQIATLREDQMIELFNSINFDVEIKNYYETNQILEQLIFTEQSEDSYMLIASTGKNPIAPFQWVNINGGNYSTSQSASADLVVANPDGLYQFVDFQVKDLSQLITIKFKR